MLQWPGMGFCFLLHCSAETFLGCLYAIDCVALPRRVLSITHNTQIPGKLCCTATQVSLRQIPLQLVLQFLAGAVSKFLRNDLRCVAPLPQGLYGVEEQHSKYIIVLLYCMTALLAVSVFMFYLVLRVALFERFHSLKFFS